MLQVNSSNGKWCVARVPLNGAVSQPQPDQPLLEFVVHNGAGQYDKPQTGTSSTCSSVAQKYDIFSTFTQAVHPNGSTCKVMQNGIATCTCTSCVSKNPSKMAQSWLDLQEAITHSVKQVCLL